MKVNTNFEHWNFVSLEVQLHSDIDSVGLVIETKLSIDKNDFEAMKNAVATYLKKFYDYYLTECQYNGFYHHGISFPYLPTTIIKGVNDDHNLYRILEESFEALDNSKKSISA